MPANDASLTKINYWGGVVSNFIIIFATLKSQ